ncbi:MAG TPA: MFS transporter [Candidatus Binataceae bacterium]|nr:MFS transporter [Candidatus Binataceae bacterium]
MPTIESLRQAPPASARPSHASRLVLFLTVFIDLLGFGIVIPFLPLFAERMHITAGGIGLILAIYSAAQFVCAPILGRISDRIGRRPIIMLGLLGSSVSYVIYGFAGSFAVLLLSRAIHGMCAGTISTAQAYIADTTAESERARGMGMIGAAFGLGFVLGPAIGGLLGHASLRTPVFFAAALTFANLIFAALALPESHPPEPGARLDLHAAVATFTSFPRNLANPLRLRLFAIAFMLTTAMAAFEMTFAIMIPAVYGYHALGVGLLLAYAGFIQALTQGYLLGKFVARVGERTVLMVGVLVFLVGIGPLASLGSHAALLIFLALLSLGYGFASPAVATLISKSAERHLQGEVLGLNQSAMSLARIAGPIGGGLAYQFLGPAAPYFASAVLAAAALTLLPQRQRTSAGRGEQA